jgi:hypothetical protein
MFTHSSILKPLAAMALALASTAAAATATDVNVVNVPVVHLNNNSVKVSGTVGVRPALPVASITQALNLSGNTLVVGDGVNPPVFTSIIMTNGTNATQNVGIQGIQTSGPNCTGSPTQGSGPNFNVKVEAFKTLQLTFPTGLIFNNAGPCATFGTGGGSQVQVQLDGYYP